MKKITVLLAILALALMAAPAAWATAYTININDLEEGNPAVTFSSGFIPNTLTLGHEYAQVTGTLNFAGSIDYSSGSVMYEPDGVTVSDFATLVYTGRTHSFTMTFDSDGSANWDSDFITFQNIINANDGYIEQSPIESGDLQNLFFGSNTVGSGPNAVTTSLSVNAQSEVPLPPSVLLMGTGLLGILGLGWRRRSS